MLHVDGFNWGTALSVAGGIIVAGLVLGILSRLT